MSPHKGIFTRTDFGQRGGEGLVLWASQVALVVKNPSASAGDIEMRARSLGGKIPWRRAWQPTPAFLSGESWTEEPGELQSVGSQRVGHA